MAVTGRQGRSMADGGESKEGEIVLVNSGGTIVIRDCLIARGDIELGMAGINALRVG